MKNEPWSSYVMVGTASNWSAPSYQTVVVYRPAREPEFGVGLSIPFEAIIHGAGFGLVAVLVTVAFAAAIFKLSAREDIITVPVQYPVQVQEDDEDDDEQPE